MGANALSTDEAETRGAIAAQLGVSGRLGKRPFMTMGAAMGRLRVFF
jgi:hypothetical protein